MSLPLPLRIKQLRREAKMSQRSLAKLVGVSQSAIAQIESGNTKALKAETLLRLSAALQANPYYIMTGRGTRETTPVTGDAQIELLALFASLPDEHQAALIAAARALGALRTITPPTQLPPPPH